MASRKKLEDLEYNVFRKDIDTNAGSDGVIGSKDAGCLTMLAVIIVTVFIIVVIVGFMQIGRNGPAPNCAYPGCSNRLKPGSSYCWLHSKSKTGSGKKNAGSAITGGDSSGGNGSVIGGSSSGSQSTEKRSSKIWGGEGNRKKSGKSGSSSEGASSSSSGGSSVGN